MAGASEIRQRAPPPGAGPAAPAAPAKPAPGVAAAGATTKERAVVGLFAGLAVGGVALIAMGGANDYSGIAVGAVMLLTVGPVAYGGLVFSMKQIAAFLASFKQKDLGDVAEAEARPAPQAAGAKKDPPAGAAKPPAAAAAAPAQ